MLLRDLMTAPVLTVAPGQPASDALAAMRDENVRHAVVVLGSTVVGVVSDGDLGGPQGGLTRVHHSVGDLMHEAPIVGAPSMPASEAVHLVREHHIGCLPILDQGKLVGIVTRSDLLRLSDPNASEGDTQRIRPPAGEDEGEHPASALVGSDRPRWP
jgi:acetoin utilization protein AcuB